LQIMWNPFGRLRDIGDISELRRSTLVDRTEEVAYQAQSVAIGSPPRAVHVSRELIAEVILHDRDEARLKNQRGVMATDALGIAHPGDAISLPDRKVRGWMIRLIRIAGRFRGHAGNEHGDHLLKPEVQAWVLNRPRREPACRFAQPGGRSHVQPQK